MSMLDAFFSKGFKGAKCKTLLKLTIPRIKLLRNRREIQLKQMRRDIAKLLENGQEATARIRVEHIVREQNMMAAQEIIELFCELISVRLPIIETQRECPIDLKEAISSICFAAPRCSDLPELQQVQMLFAAKYGREFVAAATELMPDCGVNRQIIELLSVRAPSVETKLKLLKEIAEEHELDWDPAASETEFLKPPEDLLNGPNHFISGSALPLPKEKHDESLSSTPVEGFHEEPDSDTGFDSLDLPEVPKVSVRTSSDNPSAPDIFPPQPASPPHHFGHDEIAKSVISNQDMSHDPCVEPEVVIPESPIASTYAPPNISAASRENKQFIPFVSSPSLSSTSFSLPRSEPAPSLSRTKSEVDVGLQDVLAAAHAAAESAERAAAAARSAASLAQIRITALSMKPKVSKNSEDGLHVRSPDRIDTVEKPMFDRQNSSSHINQNPGYGWNGGSGSPISSPHDVLNMEDESPGSKEQLPEHPSAHQPQRSTSLEDDPYFSYPNLFRQDSNINPGVHSSEENSPSTH